LYVVVQVLREVAAGATGLGKDGAPAEESEQAAGVEPSAQTDQAVVGVDRGHGPRASGEDHERGHPAGLVGEGAVGVVIGNQRFRDAGDEPDAGLADAAADGGVEYGCRVRHHRARGCGYGVGERSGVRDGGGPVADSVELVAYDVPHLIGGRGDDEIGG